MQHFYTKSIQKCFCDRNANFNWHLQLRGQSLPEVLADPGPVDGVHGRVEGLLRMRDATQLQVALALAHQELVRRAAKVGVACFQGQLGILRRNSNLREK